MNCSPLLSYQDLILFSKIDDTGEIYNPTFLYQNKEGKIIDTTKDKVNKVVFCHDMMGGYLDDALNTKNQNIHAYRFYHWHLIDVFIYFSHNFITIPPINWIKLCQLNGVQCLGTVIVEGDTNDNFDWLFSTDNLELGAQKLTDIKNYYHFDGWLINIECHIKKSDRKEKVENMLTFLRILKALGNEVIWYDSVTESGVLTWQNTLNSRNKCFYEAVGDNIFTNYTWNDRHIQEASIYSKKQHTSVYVGVDCFGRGCPGGGKMNCSEALRKIEENYEQISQNCSRNKEDSMHKILPKFSIALFAPGWCYESIKESERNVKLTHHVWLFYDLISQFLQPFSPVTNQNLFRSLPEFNLSVSTFQTDFSLGQAIGMFSNGRILNNSVGEQVTNSLYHNYLGDQQYFPTGLQDKDDIKLKILPDVHVGFSGYGCARLEVANPQKLRENSNQGNVSNSVVELWRMDCFVEKNNDIGISFVFGCSNAKFNMLNDSIHFIVTCSLGIDAADTMKIVCLKIQKGDRISGDNGITWSEHKWSLLTELKNQDPNCHLNVINKLSVRVVKLAVNNFEVLYHCPIYLGRFSIFPL